jgi:hypothetical protein
VVQKSESYITYELICIDKIKPLEMVFKHHHNNLMKMIEYDRGLKKPLIIDDIFSIVLDGSHRYVYLYGKGYKYAPVIKVNYKNESIRVGTHLKHRFEIDGDIGISKEEVIIRGCNGILYPPRTTRHFFPFEKYEMFIPLEDLKKGKPRDISHLMSNSSLEEELQHNEKYIKEIEEELKVINKYINAQMDTKNYLQQQIGMMREECENQK